uniref:Sodefrin-like factor n=1 Tax=Cynops pyrrhogaster TaxID=8330 RepID=A0A140IHF0_CYNPY|nr:sodefrin precursor-like factor [Cynops pyrrhogaster]
MRAILAAVVLLQALITGDCLLCEQCFALQTSSCSGIFTQCSPDVTHCVAGLENCTLGTHVILTAFKDCLDPSEKAACGREVSFTAPAASLWTSRTCCDSDFCNGGDVQVPPPDDTPSGCGSDQPCTAPEHLRETVHSTTSIREKRRKRLFWSYFPIKKTHVAPSMELPPGRLRLGRSIPSKDALLNISA